MLTTVKLYGHLGAAFGREFQFDIATVNEAVSALSANLPGFRAYLTEHSEPGYRVIVDDRPVMALEELGLCARPSGVIKIVPVVQGAGSGKAIGSIIVGVVLVVAAFFTAGQSLWGLSSATSGMISSAAAGIGMSLIASGISGLMSSVPTGIESAKLSNNFGFSNAQDTIVQGVRIPIGYGRMLCEGYPVSVRLVVENG